MRVAMAGIVGMSCVTMIVGSVHGRNHPNDFRGSSALAYHAGTARGSDGQTYNLETDMRAFEGDYVVDGEERHGAFALV